MVAARLVGWNNFVLILNVGMHFDSRIITKQVPGYLV